AYAELVCEPGLSRLETETPQPDPRAFLDDRAGSRTTTTEQCAFIATASETLPNRKRLKPRRPCDPTTMRSAFHFFASSKMTSFGLPESTVTVASNPAEVRTSSALLLLTSALVGLSNQGSSTETILNWLCSGQGRLATAWAAAMEISEPSVANNTLLGLSNVRA